LLKKALNLKKDGSMAEANIKYILEMKNKDLINYY
jgi:hypothetical protein